MKEKGFCYKLADFDLKAAKVLQDLQSQSEFCDVSVGCSDSNGELLRGHMAILASFSTVFKDMFYQMREEFGTKQRGAFLFLRGVSHQDLAAIMDFIYQGEVRVLQERIDSFLATADDLNIFGLTSNTRSESRDQKRSTRSMFRSEQKFKPVPKNREPEMYEEDQYDDQYDNGFDNDYFPPLSSKLAMMPQNGFDNDYKMDQMDDEIFHNVKQEVAEDLTLAEDEAGVAPSEEVMPRTGNKLRSSDNKSYFAKCKICGKEGRRDSIKIHVRSMHGGSKNEGERAPFKNDVKTKKVPMKPISLPPDFSRDNIKYFDHEAHWDPKWSAQIAKNPLIPVRWVEEKGMTWLEYLQNDSDISQSKFRCRICYNFGNLTEKGRQALNGGTNEFNSPCPISKEEGAMKTTSDLTRKMLFNHMKSELHTTTLETLTQKRDEMKS